MVAHKTLLSGAFALFCLFASHVALASPGGLSVHVPQEMVTDVPANGALLLDGYASGLVGVGDAPEYVEFVVTGPGGQQVDGTVDVIMTENQGWCCAEVMVIWQPDQVLASDTVYDVLVRRASVDVYADPPGPDWEEPSEESMAFRTGEARTFGVESVNVFGATVEFDHRVLDWECCQSDQGCDDGQSSCRRCWERRTERYPVVQAWVGLSGSLASSPEWLYRVIPAGGDVLRYRELVGNSGFRVDFPSGHAGSYCLSVEALHAANGAIVASDEVCVPESDGANIGITTKSRPDYCLVDEPGGVGMDAGMDGGDGVDGEDGGVEPDAASFDAASDDVEVSSDATVDGSSQGAPDAPADVADDMSSRSDSQDRSAGCSHARGGAGSSWLLFGLPALVIAGRRRLICRRGK